MSRRQRTQRERGQRTSRPASLTGAELLQRPLHVGRVRVVRRQLQERLVGSDGTRRVADLLGDLRHEYGLVVAARSASAPYSGQPLETGDVIYQINRESTASVKAMRQTLEAMKPGDAVVLQVERNGRLLYLGLELE